MIANRMNQEFLYLGQYLEKIEISQEEFYCSVRKSIFSHHDSPTSISEHMIS